MYHLNGKVALVTGAAGAHGLGRAIALRLAQEGADVVVNDLSEDTEPQPGLPAIVREIEAQGRRALPVYADVADARQVDAMLAAALEALGRVDILVNHAGAPAGADRVPVVELEEAAFDLVLRVNVKGTFLCSRAAARHMIERGGGGRIINVSSVSGRVGIAKFAAYCASKFAVRGFTQSLALELARHKITVNAICPGLLATERIDDMATALAPPGVDASDYRETMIADSLASTPLGRMTETSDVANMAAFVASDQGAFITGASLTVDGGLRLD